VPKLQILTFETAIIERYRFFRRGELNHVLAEKQGRRLELLDGVLVLFSI
jgi:hypothetical protein